MCRDCGIIELQDVRLIGQCQRSDPGAGALGARRDREVGAERCGCRIGSADAREAPLPVTRNRAAQNSGDKAGTRCWVRQRSEQRRLRCAHAGPGLASVPPSKGRNRAGHARARASEQPRTLGSARRCNPRDGRATILRLSVVFWSVDLDPTRDAAARHAAADEPPSTTSRGLTTRRTRHRHQSARPARLRRWHRRRAAAETALRPGRMLRTLTSASMAPAWTLGFA